MTTAPNAIKRNAISFYCYGFLWLFITLTANNLSAQQKKQTKKISVQQPEKKQTNKINEKPPDPKIQWRRLGYKANLAGDWEIALKNYEQILAEDSTDYDALLATARLYYKFNKYDQAIKLYTSIYNNDQLDVEALNGLGECYLQQGNNKEAINYFQRAVSLLPKHVPLYLNLAKAYMANNETELAEKIYVKSMEYDNTYAEAWAGIGKILYWKNKPKRALEHYEKAIRLNPSDEKLKAAYKIISNELALTVTAGINSIQEEEELYRINTWLLRLGVSKDHY